MIGKQLLTRLSRRVSIQRVEMASDDESTMQVDFPNISSKGKGKATQHDNPADNDNLPWRVFVDLALGCGF